MVWRSFIAAAMWGLIAASAGAETLPEPCSGALLSEQARLSCDTARADALIDAAAATFGAPASPSLTIVDTKAPSGAAYVYHVFASGDGWALDARSVPQAGGLACRLITQLPQELAERAGALAGSALAMALPAYGPREEIEINPDGSRRMRLVLDSHDVITDIFDRGKLHRFSRHAGFDDEITRLNALVIDHANRSSDWYCPPRRRS